MSRIEPFGNKFKRIEKAMRNTLLAYNQAWSEINTALDGPRTKREIEELNSLKKEWGESHQKAYHIVNKLLDISEEF